MMSELKQLKKLVGVNWCLWKPEINFISKIKNKFAFCHLFGLQGCSSFALPHTYAARLDN